MGEPTSPPDLSVTATELARLKTKLAEIPPDKKGALVFGIDWRGGVPVWARAGVATRIGEHLQLSVEAETRFKKAPPNSGVYVAWVWLLLIALWLPVTAAAQPAPAITYQATLERVIDGDTYVLRVALGFDVSYTATIRLADLDTPERFTDAGRRASAAAESLLRSGHITVQPTGAMTFARHVAHVYVNGKSVASQLDAAGFRKR